MEAIMNTTVKFFNGVYNGEALFVSQEANISYYKREGFGVMNYQGGMRYEGYWENNQRCGNGKVFYIDGDVYVGTFYKDKKHGDGVLYRANGDIYKMNFFLDRLVSREKVLDTEKAPINGAVVADKIEAELER